MDADQRLFAVGAYISAALFLIGVFVMAMVQRNHLAQVYVLAAAATAFVAYVCQIYRNSLAGWIFTCASWVASGGAFLMIVRG